MTSPLAYDVLRNIFEHLTLEKRIQLVLSCPNLKTIERNAPLSIDFLWINKLSWEFHINNLQFSFKLYNGYLKIVRDRIVTELETRTQPVVLMKKIIDLYLSDREFVKVRLLNFTCADIFKFPKGLKIELRELGLFSKTLNSIRIIETSKLLVNSNSDVLKKLHLTVIEPDDEIFQEQLLRDAKCLKIRKLTPTCYPIMENIIGLKNREIQLEQVCRVSDSAKTEVVSLARSWLEKCPAIGTRFTLRMNIRDYQCIQGMLDWVKEELSTNESFKIQLRSGDHLKLYGELYSDEKYQLIMEVV